jgi:hypothetical protein
VYRVQISLCGDKNLERKMMNADAVQQKEVACTPSLTGKVSASWNDTHGVL